MSNAELRKAAVLLSSLRPRQATGLLAGLDDARRNAVLSEMLRRDHPTQQEQAAVLVDLATAAKRSPDVTDARGLKRPTWSNRATNSRSANGEIRASSAGADLAVGRPFAALQSVTSHAIRKILRSEHPQLIALVLAHLAAAQAADVLAEWPGELVGSILRRMSNLAAVSPEATAEIDRWLKRRLASLDRSVLASTR